MSAPKPRSAVSNRGWTNAQVAQRLGVSISWLQENRANLEKEGFPKADQLLAGRTDSKAVELWLDRRSGIAANDDIGFDIALQRVRQRVENRP